MADDTPSVIEEARSAGAVLAEAATGPAQPVAQSKWYRWRKEGTALIAYLLDSEVHTFAFSVAANAILSFIPFVVLLYRLAHSVFRSPTMVVIVGDMVNYYLPSYTRQQNWLADAIRNYALASGGHGLDAMSIIMILISCTGIFLPLEVALNQAWGIAKSRNYLLNQSIAFGLALVMVVLAVVCLIANWAVDSALTTAFFHHTDNPVFKSLTYAWLASSTGIASILFFFAVYYVLPNRKVPWRPVIRTSIVTGIVWLASKLIFVAALPHLDLSSLYGPFYVSVGLLFWSYVSGLILFAGAQFSVARWTEKEGNSK